MSWLLKKIGKTLFNGQSVMNISLPVFIFQARTMLQIFAYEFRLAPYYFKKAFYSQDKYEKLKYLTTFLVTQSYFSTSISKPFSPRLGETYQTKIGDFVVVKVTGGITDKAAFGQTRLAVHLFARDIAEMKNSKKLSVMQKKLVNLPLWIQPDTPGAGHGLLIDGNPRVVGDTPDDFGFHARIITFKVTIKVQ